MCYLRSKTPSCLPLLPLENLNNLSIHLQKTGIDKLSDLLKQHRKTSQSKQLWIKLDFRYSWNIYCRFFYSGSWKSITRYPNSLSEYCGWAEKSEKSMLHAKCMYGTLVRVTPSFHHHLSQNLLSSTFAPLWTYEENMEFSYDLWMEASQRGFVDVSVCVQPADHLNLFFGLPWKHVIKSQESDKHSIIFHSRMFEATSFAFSCDR